MEMLSTTGQHRHLSNIIKAFSYHCGGLGSKDLTCGCASNNNGDTSGQVRTRCGWNRGCMEVGQHPSGADFPVLIPNTEQHKPKNGAREQARAVEGSQEYQKNLKAPQTISRKVQKNRLHMITRLMKNKKPNPRVGKIYLWKGPTTKCRWCLVIWIDAGPRIGDLLSSPT